MSDKNVQGSGGVSGTTLLTILFIGLKLAHIINWSWWWVLSPLWISLAVILGIVALYAILAVVVVLVKGIGTK